MLDLDDVERVVCSQGSVATRRSQWSPSAGTVLLGTLTTFLSIGDVAGAQQPETANSGESGQEVWITDVCWLDNEVVAGTRSQGLLLREGSVVTAQAADLSMMQEVGTSASSLWALAASRPSPSQGDGGSDSEDLAGNDQSVGAAWGYSSNYKGTIQFHRLMGSGELPSRELEADLKWCRALALGPDSKVLLAGCEDGKLVRIDLESGQKLSEIDAHSGAIFDITFEPNWERVATCGADGKIALFSWPEFKLVDELQAGSEVLWSVAFVGEDRLVSGGSGRRVQLWDLSSSELVCSLATAHDWVSSLTVLPDSPIVLATCFNGELLVCDPASKTLLKRMKVTESAIWSAALSPDSTRLLIGTRQHGFRCVDLPDWTEAQNRAARQAKDRAPPKPNGTIGVQ